MKHTVQSRFACALLILATIANAGCAVQQQRVSQFGNFAQAGIAFADAIPPVLDESFQAAVAADTLILKEVRGEFTDTE